jgi:hypothetical protein
MARRGTFLKASSTISAGYEAKRWYSHAHSLGASGNGAGSGTPEGVGQLGTSGKTLAIGGLDTLTDSDQVGLFIPNLEDVDLTKSVYFDLYFYFGPMAGGDEGITSITTTAVDWNPDRATADGISTDEDALSLTGASARAYAATDICNIRKVSTKTLAANAMSDNAHGIILHHVILVEGTMTSKDVVYVGTMMRYTLK